MINQKDVRCDSCNITYKSYHSLLRHNDQIHSDNPTFQCSQCPKSCGGKNELERHMKTHDTENVFKSTCSFCEGKYKTEDSLKYHMKRAHTREKTHVCNICQRKFPFPYDLKQHQATHETKPLAEYLECDKCPKKLKTKACLELHKLMHLGIKPYKCDFCDKKFRQAAHKRTHQRLIHEAAGVKAFKCNECPKYFTESRHRYIHQQAHYKEPSQCDVCKKYVKNMLQHTQRIHSDKSKSVSCHICGFISDSQGNMKIHEKTHTGEKDKICPHCDYKTPYSQGLKIHIRTHTGERPFKCTECDYTAAIESTLTNHMQTMHAEIEWLKCQICSKELKKQSYKPHMSEHFNEAKFECGTCHKVVKKHSKRAHEATHFKSTISTQPKKVKVVKRVICSACEKSFKGPQALEQHMITWHTSERPHKCGMCSKDFPLEYMRDDHQQSHTERVVYCNFCNKRYSLVQSLRRHIKSLHNKASYACQHCDKQYNRADVLKNHVKY